MKIVISSQELLLKSMQRKNVLFISHDAARMGAPAVLLHLLKWIKEQRTNLVFDVLLLEGGEMTEQFASLANKLFLLSDFRDPAANTLTARILWRISRQFGKTSKAPLDRLLDVLRHRSYDVVYANTVASVETGLHIKATLPQSPQLVCHVHELELMTHQFAPLFGEMQLSIDFFVAVSAAVKRSLLSSFDVPEQRIKVVYEFVDTTRWRSHGGSVNEDIRTRLGISEEAVIVGGAGLVYWRKGYDLFIQTAFNIGKHNANHVHFVWVGKLSSQQRQMIEADLRKSGLNDTVHFVGQQEQPLDYFRTFDLFMLPSREDPFPLVCLEVGALGVPILCFEDAGGIPEMVDATCGRVVPYMDVEAMTNAVLELANDQPLRDRLGEAMMKRVQGYDVKIMAPKIYSLLAHLLMADGQGES